jgi:hypothetical protein
VNRKHSELVDCISSPSLQDNLSGRGMNTSQINIASGLKARKTIEESATKVDRLRVKMRSDFKTPDKKTSTPSVISMIEDELPEKRTYDKVRNLRDEIANSSKVKFRQENIASGLSSNKDPKFSVVKTNKKKKALNYGERIGSIGRNFNTIISNSPPSSNKK